MKKCAGKCQLEKNESEFSSSQFKRNNGICRVCKKEYDKEYRKKNKEKDKIKRKTYRDNNKEKISVANKIYREENKEKLKEKKKIYYEENKEEINTQKKEYYEENKEIILEQQHLYYEENKEEIFEYQSNYRENNKEKISNYHRKYRSENKVKIRKNKSKWKAKKRKEDPSFRVAELFSSMVRYELKIIGASKNGSSIWDHLPYTKEQLKLHIESTWSLTANLDENRNVWMSWNNYGPVSIERKTWQIDHKKPQSHPDCKYTSMSDPGFLECWGLHNLQAMESFANIKKSNKY